MCTRSVFCLTAFMVMSASASCGSRDLPGIGASQASAALSVAGPDEPDHDDRDDGWPQWGHDARHSGRVHIAGQALNRQRADLVYDPLVSAEQADSNGELLVHYQAPLIGRNDVFMEFKGGTWVACNPPSSGTPFPCGSDAWNAQTWNEKRLRWEGGKLVEKWTFQSDWKPEPDSNNFGGWEPVFHAVLAGDRVYVPGSGGTLFKLDRETGAVRARINPFATLDPATFVTGPPSADPEGNVYYNVIKLVIDPDPARSNPWFGHDVAGAWLVKVRPDGSTRLASYDSLVPGAPQKTDLCSVGGFGIAQLPWPPSPTATVLHVPCGSQRPGVNVGPAVGGDGTIYTVSRAHFAARHGFVVAVNRDLTPRWAASLRDHLHDGCGSPILPPDGAPGGCRIGANPGVDPRTNELPAGAVIDLSSSTPVVTPDGSVLYGAFTAYNAFRGHLFKFGHDGGFLNAFDFGWDTTPAIYAHEGTYSVVLKDNHYGGFAICADPTLCPVLQNGPYNITQLDKHLLPEWKFKNTNTESCARQPDGTLKCVSDHPDGFEWCINAPAIDRKGVVYANSEDGNLYAIRQGGIEKQRIFTNLALAAAYTPLSLGRDGTLYTQNAGHLFVVGN